MYWALQMPIVKSFADACSRKLCSDTHCFTDKYSSTVGVHDNRFVGTQKHDLRINIQKQALQRLDTTRCVEMYNDKLHRNLWPLLVWKCLSLDVGKHATCKVWFHSPATTQAHAHAHTHTYLSLKSFVATSSFHLSLYTGKYAMHKVWSQLPVITVALSATMQDTGPLWCLKAYGWNTQTLIRKKWLKYADVWSGDRTQSTRHPESSCWLLRTESKNCGSFVGLYER